MTSTLPEEAVKAACDAYKLEDDRLSGIGMMRALEAAAPFLPAQVAVKKLDLTVLERLAENAEQYDHPDDNGPFPDIQDAMVTVGDLRQARKLLSILSALEPSAARELALYEGDDICARLKGLASWLDSSQHSKWCGRKEVPIHGYSSEGKLVRAAIAAIRALSSPDHADAGKVEGDGWRPISSAPRDGTLILAWNYNSGMQVVGWQPAYGSHPFDEDHWDDVGSKNAAPSIFVNARHFTHWRHLPSAPASEGAE